jgi:hypothetical protein
MSPIKQSTSQSDYRNKYMLYLSKKGVDFWGHGPHHYMRPGWTRSWKHYRKTQYYRPSLPNAQFKAGTEEISSVAPKNTL